MNTLLRPALYNAFHHVFAPESSAELCEQNLCGQICESTDVFARNRLLPKLVEGDLLVFENAGAYGYGLGLAFNGRARAAEVLVDDQSAKLIRRRENMADLLALVPHFDSSKLT